MRASVGLPLVTWLACIAFAVEGGATPPLPLALRWPTVGVPVAASSGAQITGDILADGIGGAFVAWTDTRTDESGLDLYIQRVDGSGRIAWRAHAERGLPLCTQPGRQFQVRLVTDATGGVIATWYDERGESPDIYALRITRDGGIANGWSADGVPICTAIGAQIDPVIVGDGEGGAYIAWMDSREGFKDSHIYLQRILANGSVADGWPVNGLRMAMSPAFEDLPSIISDDDGGAFVTWGRYRGDGIGFDLISTRITSAASTAPGWPDSGLAVCSAPGSQDMALSVPDGQGGLYIVWRDYRDETDFSDGGEGDIYAQRVASDGVFPQGWGGNGIPVRVAPGDQFIPQAMPDGAGGLLVSWRDDPLGGPNLFVQRMKPDGTVAPGWDPAGVSAGTVTAAVNGAALVGDGVGGAIVAWNDFRGWQSSHLDVYVQRISAEGKRAGEWASAGTPVCTKPGEQQIMGSSVAVSMISSDGNGGAIVAWNDFGVGYESDVFLQRVTSSGTVGPRTCPGCDAIEYLSPNPGPGRFRIEARVPEGGRAGIISAYDIAGRIVLTKRYAGLPATGEAELEFDLSDVPAGVYFLKYTVEGDSRLLGKRRVVVLK